MGASKVLLVSRADLSKAQQGVQAMHALTEFIFEHHDIAREWKQESNTLAWLTVSDEKALYQLLTIANERGIRSSGFKEPDIDDQLTAICLEPTEQARKLCRNLRLALQ
jgi:peptidyl-tRNA hydrolase